MKPILLGLGLLIITGFAFGVGIEKLQPKFTDLIKSKTPAQPLQPTGAVSQKPDPNPSDRALEVSSYLYINSTEAEQKKFINDWGLESDSPSIAVKNLAIHFDQNSPDLALAEAWIDRNRADGNRPVVNYQPPAIDYQPPDIKMQAPPVNNSMRCTSNRLGDYTYTNCY